MTIRALAYTVMFDDLDRGRRMIAQVSEAAFFYPADHPDCEGIYVEPMARGAVHSEQYDTRQRGGVSPLSLVLALPNMEEHYAPR